MHKHSLVGELDWHLVATFIIWRQTGLIWGIQPTCVNGRNSWQLRKMASTNTLADFTQVCTQIWHLPWHSLVEKREHFWSEAHYRSSEAHYPKLTAINALQCTKYTYCIKVIITVVAIHHFLALNCNSVLHCISPLCTPRLLLQCVQSQVGSTYVTSTYVAYIAYIPSLVTMLQCVL